MAEKGRGAIAHVGEILKDRTIIFVGGDAFTEKGFTQFPNAILRAKKLGASGNRAGAAGRPVIPLT